MADEILLKDNIIHKKSMKLMDTLMQHIKRDILNTKTEAGLKLYTQTNPLTIRKYQDEVNKFVDSVDNVLKQNMK
jgi:hypothetical protein